MVILNRALSMLEIVSDHPDGVLLSYIATATELPLAIAYRLPRARLCGWS
jgi:DNA-binding IclR family transcriptional regulator